MKYSGLIHLASRFEKLGRGGGIVEIDGVDPSYIPSTVEPDHTEENPKPMSEEKARVVLLQGLLRAVKDDLISCKSQYQRYESERDNKNATNLKYLEYFANQIRSVTLGQIADAKNGIPCDVNKLVSEIWEIRDEADQVSKDINSKIQLSELNSFRALSNMVDGQATPERQRHAPGPGRQKNGPYSYQTFIKEHYKPDPNAPASAPASYKSQMDIGPVTPDYRNRPDSESPLAQMRKKMLEEMDTEPAPVSTTKTDPTKTEPGGAPAISSTLVSDQDGEDTKIVPKTASMLLLARKIATKL